MSDDPKMERFMAAFSDGCAGCRRECECGKTYYNSDGGWDWDEGELEELESMKDAFDVDYTPGTISFGGETYVDACDCWHAKARKVIHWLDHHSSKVARYLNGEKAAATKAAASMPEVSAQNSICS